MRGPATLRVNIYEDCDVDFESVNVFKPFGDQIEWQSTGDAFDIEFDSTPFEGNGRYYIPPGGRVPSGRVREDAVYATYHYVIRSRVDLAKSADPEVNIKH